MTYNTLVLYNAEKDRLYTVTKDGILSWGVSYDSIYGGRNRDWLIQTLIYSGHEIIGEL